MGRRDDVSGEPPDGSGEATNDREWAQELWSAVRCAGVLLALLLLIDWGSGRLTPWRTVLWCALSGLLFLVLCPDRVSAGGNWLASRRLLRERQVRTDLLVSVRCLDGISQRIVLRDALGGRVELDPEVLVRNPRLWSSLDGGARKAAEDGLLLCGATVLRRISRRVDRETARAVFKASGLE
ncbi:hypothetical protein K4B79_11900 [Streptomyces lincolnensis]|uniref:hypothetical protein n=1 Tax=Streptomyces lincolnensis TaxID=1915 RepID=UPI001E3B4A62|nr:hypothetical protein [Streptomyces lincolnensis]MCD7438926.1 hypothetical protein [Streptomyces lincolnensis]